MSIVLYHHPFSRAATVVWMLEELGIPYTLSHVDLRAGQQKTDAHRGLNAMGKIPVLVDGDAIVSETSAIGMYLADRYAPGVLAPALDDPARGTYLRWCVFPPSVLEPGCTARRQGWEFGPGQVGWGTYAEMCDTLTRGLEPGPWLLADRFTMADVLVGASLRWMVGFNMLDPLPSVVSYLERLEARPARQSANAKNAAIVAERGLQRG